jgi:hypothetical protein
MSTTISINKIVMWEKRLQDLSGPIGPGTGSNMRTAKRATLVKSAREQMLRELKVRSLVPRSTLHDLQNVVDLADLLHKLSIVNAINCAKVIYDAMEDRFYGAVDNLLDALEAIDPFTCDEGGVIVMACICNVVLFCAHWVPKLPKSGPGKLDQKNKAASLVKLFTQARQSLNHVAWHSSHFCNDDGRPAVVDALVSSACPFMHRGLKEALVGKLLKKVLTTIHAGEMEHHTYACTISAFIEAYSTIISADRGYLPLYERARTIADKMEASWGLRPNMAEREP